jgi:hypothetical protein
MHRMLLLSLVALSLLVPLGCAKKKGSMPLADQPQPQTTEREFELRLEPQLLQRAQPAPLIELRDSDERPKSDPAKPDSETRPAK